MIPAGFFDFGKQLFPELISKKAPVYGYNMVEYWSDVGGLDKYIQSNYDAMKGLVQIRIPGNKKASSTWVGERERIDPSARFEGSVIIGDRCSIGKDVYIKDAVIGDKCVIRDGAVVTGSVLWSDVIVSSGSAVSDSVIGNFSYVGENVKVPSGSVIANRSVIRSGSTLQGSLHLKPNSII